MYCVYCILNCIVYRGCTSGGVYVPCIYTAFKWMLSQTQIIVHSVDSWTVWTVWLRLSWTVWLRLKSLCIPLYRQLNWRRLKSLCIPLMNCLIQTQTIVRSANETETKTIGTKRGKKKRKKGLFFFASSVSLCREWWYKSFCRCSDRVESTYKGVN